MSCEVDQKGTVVQTNVDELPLPDWLRAAVLVGSRAQVREQGFDVGRAWWEQRLRRHGLAEDLFANGYLSREDLFTLGQEAPASPAAARTLLWGSCAWGTGASQRGNGRRVRGVARNADDCGRLLADAADVARRDPEEAYASLHSRGNRIYGFGPAFSTKFLYFAGAGADDHCCLILDARVARRLRRDCGWTSLTGTTGWPPATYGRYLRLLRRWADELSSDDRTIAPDEIEYVLFSAPPSTGTNPGAGEQISTN